MSITSVGSRAAERSFNLSSKGATVTQWREMDKDIFYPVTQITTEKGERKQRGGMHPCFPNFGTVDEKYGLPQHGPLRNVTGVINGASELDEYRWRFPDSRELFGNFDEPCSVRVNVLRFYGGFWYRLGADLSSAATKSVPISAGFHPYFATPEGTATVKPYGRDKFEVKDLLKEAVAIPLPPVVTLDIPGTGKVEMAMDGELVPGLVNRDSPARLVLWRDRLDYLCVEPVLALGADFDTLRCPRLHPGHNTIMIGCKFRVL